MIKTNRHQSNQSYRTMEYHDGTTDPNLGPMAEEKKKWLEKVRA